MKKFCKLPFPLNEKAKKMILTMKLTVLISFLTLMQVSATVYSQSTKFSFRAENMQVVEMLRQIEENSEFRFFFLREQVDVERKVTVIAREATVEQILDELFRGQPVSYEFANDALIVLTHNDNPLGSVSKYLQGNMQQPAVSGKVNEFDGQPLPGVTVVVKGTTQGTVTNADGNYSLTNIPDDATLVFSFVGMLTQEVAVGNQTSISVTMEQDVFGIEEVVAVGYGTQEKRTLTGSVAQINSAELSIVPSSSVTEILGGRLPGLVAKQSSGAPGRQPSLSIRGFNTAGEGALVIVDGVERDFGNLDPNEIESITILKDASAAIYGARAASGVILVTTKRGKIGKPTITYNGTTSFQTPTGYPKTIDAKTALESPLISNIPQISDERIDGILNGSIPSTNFQKELLKKWSPLNNHNLNLRGGSDNALYFVSAGYMDQGAGFKTGDYGFERLNINSNLDLKINKSLKIDINLGWRREVREENPVEGWNRVYNWMQIAHPAYPLRNRDGSLSTNAQGPHSSEAVTSEEIAGMSKSTNDVFNGAFGFEYSVPGIKGLSAEGKLSVVSSNHFNKNFRKKFTLYVDDGVNFREWATNNPNGPSLEEVNRRSQRVTSILSLRYKRTFGSHEITGLALWETINDQSNFNRVYRDQLLSPDIPYIFTGSLENQQTGGDASEDGRESFVGRINYNFKGKYYFEGTFRFDAVPRFPADTRWGGFPGASIAWRISEEGFMQDVSFLDNLKLRLSAANLGNDNTNGRYNYLSGFSIIGNTNQWYYWGNTLQPAINTLGVPNPEITWQEANLYNAGLDVAFLNNKLAAELDVFYRKRTGLLATANSQIPQTVGANLPQTNINSRDNRGFEAVVTYNERLSDFNFSVSGNVSWNREKYLHFEEPEYTSEDDIRIRKNSGRWVNRTVGYVFDGFFNSQTEINESPINYSYNPRPGDIRYKDVNGDGVVNSLDRTEIGKGGMPEWMFGLNFKGRWKGFDMTMFWQGAAGFVTNMNDWNRAFRPNMARVPFQYVFDNVWTEENKENALFPARWEGWNQQTNDEYLIDSRYLRLKNLVFGYTFPKSLLSSAGIQSTRVYVSGTNLVTFDALGIFGEFDPENSGFGGYPQQMVLTVGISISL